MLLNHINHSSYRKPLIYCVSFLLVFLTDIAIIACGPEADPYDYYVSFFHNNLAENNAYQPFSFTGYTFVYDDNEPQSEPLINSSEWAGYFKGDVKVSDVAKVMYGLNAPTDSVVNAAYFSQKSKLPDSLTQNSFLKALQQKKYAGALAYYELAKKIEPEATVENQWDPQPRDTAKMISLANEASKLGSKETDSFLKLRYFYQAQRMFRYAGNRDKARNVYTTYIEKQPSASHVKGWSLSLQAGVEPDSVRSAYLFSRVFENYPERRIQAYRNYYYNHANASDVLKLAKNDSEKAVIYAIEGLGDPEYNINYLKEIYGCQPNSPVIGILLAREVNKLEEQFLDNKIDKRSSPILNPVKAYYYAYGFNYVDPEQAKSDKIARAHMADLSKFCEQVFTERKFKDYGLAKIVQAYLSWMLDDTKAGTVYLSQLDKVSLRNKLNDQKQIVKLLLTAQSIQKLDSLNEVTLLPLLQWLDKKVESEANAPKEVDNYMAYSTYSYRRFTGTARNFYQTVLAPAYYKQGYISKAAAAVVKGESLVAHKEWRDEVTTNFWQNYLRPGSVLKLIEWKNRSPNDPYLKLLTSNLAFYSNSNLYELLGTTYLREHQYQKAITALNRVGEAYSDSLAKNSFSSTEESDPFINQMADYPKVWTKAGSKGYNKLDFAKAMYALQRKMKTEPNNADHYFKYATALYNTGMHGNSWQFISYTWAAADAGRKKVHYYDDDYIQSINAEQYFLKARAVSNNTEFKAKCTFMAAKCRQKQIIKPEYYGNDYDKRIKKYAAEVRHNPFFEQLTVYSKTRFYKQAVNDCSYLRDFLKSR
ncbi:hypothetical protein CLV57_3332 [Mucilaginibacter auburnensis]|uniref:Tetratricopeptide repeat protein n=2 Tax=Mucilaginibacter auburnensis TaxID=1457233 RepID=A0A2H9VPB0_9SPHI|nr:hypothetical protein CLV57_3332 [Mucilaginibacter auburnensis]